MKLEVRFDYRKLRGKIREAYGTQKSFCYAMHMNDATLSAKLNSKTPFSQDEICKAVQLLGVQSHEIPVYFFSQES